MYFKIILDIINAYIILKNKNVWSINYESAKKFLKEGYICNENTLIEKIYKITSKIILVQLLISVILFFIIK